MVVIGAFVFCKMQKAGLEGKQNECNLDNKQG